MEGTGSMEDFYQAPWLVFMLGRERYALPTRDVQAMVKMPELVPVPLTPPFVRGVINVRGETTPLIDLRVKLGMESLRSVNQAHMEMIQEREQDHRSWLDELLKSVEEERRFALATDHHQCKFGKWYDSYEPVSLLERELYDKMDVPHKDIHDIAKKCEALIGSGQQGEAVALIKRATRKELAAITKLFKDYIALLNKQLEFEIAIILDVNGVRGALAVDTIVSVEKLSSESVEPMPAVSMGGMACDVEFIARCGKDKKLVYLLSAANLVADAHS